MADVLLLFLVIFLSLSSLNHGVLSASTITHLPGFDGPLPFHLETGYVSLDENNDDQLFYYFFKSERNPLEDPLLLWLTGGPGCSVMSAWAFINGPLMFKKEEYNGSTPNLQQNPNSWTKVSSIVYLDSPVGTGFSFSRRPDGYMNNDTSFANQAHQFIRKGYLIGNPVTNENYDLNSRLVHAHALWIISSDTLETTLSACKGQSIGSPRTMYCATEVEKFNNVLSEINQAHVLEPYCIDDTGTLGRSRVNRRFLDDYNYSVLSNPPRAPPIYCRSYSVYLGYHWANLDITRAALHVQKESIGEWQRCNRTVYSSYTHDIVSSIPYHQKLINSGLRVLVYSGDHDLRIPVVGTKQ